MCWIYQSKTSTNGSLPQSFRNSIVQLVRETHFIIFFHLIFFYVDFNLNNVLQLVLQFFPSSEVAVTKFSISPMASMSESVFSYRQFSSCSVERVSWWFLFGWPVRFIDRFLLLFNTGFLKSSLFCPHEVFRPGVHHKESCSASKLRIFWLHSSQIFAYVAHMLYKDYSTFSSIFLQFFTSMLHNRSDRDMEEMCSNCLGFVLQEFNDHWWCLLDSFDICYQL